MRNVTYDQASYRCLCSSCRSWFTLIALYHAGHGLPRHLRPARHPPLHAAGRDARPAGVPRLLLLAQQVGACVLLCVLAGCGSSAGSWCATTCLWWTPPRVLLLAQQVGACVLVCVLAGCGSSAGSWCTTTCLWWTAPRVLPLAQQGPGRQGRRTAGAWRCGPGSPRRGAHLVGVG